MNSGTRRLRSKSKIVLLSLCSIGVLVFGVIALTFAFNTFQGPDLGSCRSIYMYPSYMRVNGFDETHTKFARKYSLFLYREQGSDPDFTQVQGIPVLFIPGNAGSYKQVRSLASLTSRLYFDDYHDYSDKRNLDFFAADFNEDLTAFHGRTMLDQSEYLNEAIKFILSLYELQPEHSRPQSVLIVAHSMGGIVARTIMTLPNYQQDTVNTIITLATPHSAAPATFDGDILKIYSDVDDFWRSAFADELLSKSETHQKLHAIAHERLKNVALISITGGMLDNTLPADYTQTGGLFPSNQSLTVFTSGIPGVYTPIDHLAIVWCDQLRQKLAQVLILVTTAGSRDCTYPIETRMSIFRSALLSGFEDLAQSETRSRIESSLASNADVKLRLDSALVDSNTMRVSSNEAIDKTEFNLFKIKPESQFTLLSSLSFTDVSNFDKDESENPVVVGCRVTDHSSDLHTIDLTSASSTEFTELDCIDLSFAVREAPRSMPDTGSLADSALGGDKAPFHVLQYKPTLGLDAIVVIYTPKLLKDNFVVAECQPSSTVDLKLGETGFWNLLKKGYDLSLPSHKPLAVNISIESAWSSLLAYRVKISGLSQDSGNQLFVPFMRQSIGDPYETKWHIDIHNRDTRSVTFHANSPFVQFSKKSDIVNLNLQLWTDSLMLDESPIDIYLSIDLVGSLKLLVLRYRLAVIAFPLAVCFIVLFLQLSVFHKSGTFISVWDGLLELSKRNVLLPILVVLSILTPLTNNEMVQKLLRCLNPVKYDSIAFQDYTKNVFFLGIRENYLFLLGPLFFVISVSLVAFLHELIMVLGQVITICYGMILRGRKSASISSASSVSYNESTISLETSLNSSKASNSRSFFQGKRHLMGMILLINSVSFFIPYQMAYLICCMVQLGVVIRLSIRQHYFNYHDYDTNVSGSTSSIEQKTKIQNKKNQINYHFTILNLMVWLIPINVPVVVVFLHNFSLRWSTPFSSHHNILAIMPILILVEMHVDGKMIENHDRARRIMPLLSFLLIYITAFAFIDGIKNLFFLHHLFCLFAGVLCFGY